MSVEKAIAGVMTAAALAAAAMAGEVTEAARFRFDFECRDADGNLKWVDTAYNLVTTVGKNRIIDVLFRAQAAGTWYVGLKGAGAAAVGDTAASHATWSEITAYAEAARQTLTLAAASGGSANNSAAKAVFTMNGSATVAGSFIIDNNTKGGTTGNLYSAGDFSGGSRAVQSGDTLSVTCTVTIA